MNLKFWKKQEKEYKRPNYYPTMRVKYEVKNVIQPYFRIRIYIQRNKCITDVNFCCKKMKDNFAFNDGKIGDTTDKLIEFHRFGDGDYLNFSLVPKKRLFGEKIFYCPFCGAKIEFEKIRVLRKKKVCHDEVIPARIERICKYEWVEQ